MLNKSVGDGYVPPERIREVIPDLVVDLDRYRSLLQARIDAVVAAR